MIHRGKRIVSIAFNCIIEKKNQQESNITFLCLISGYTYTIKKKHNYEIDLCVSILCYLVKFIYENKVNSNEFH